MLMYCRWVVLRVKAQAEQWTFWGKQMFEFKQRGAHEMSGAFRCQLLLSVTENFKKAG